MKKLSLNELPQDCVTNILSLSSPRDVCRCAATCSELHLVSESDRVWESFLPGDYHEIVSSVDPSLLRFGSKKELFFLLCNSLLIDGGNKALYLDKVTGHKSYVISARDLSIVWANEPFHWCWKNITQSRFMESVELITTSWLEIHGYIKMKMLSPNTTYGAYLMFKVCKRAHGLDKLPMEVSVKVGNDLMCHNTVHLRPDDGKNHHQIQWTLHYDGMDILTSRLNQRSEGGVPVRDDGWMEIELGHFFSGETTTTCSGDGDKVVEMSLMEINGCHLKGGLVVEGIEIRPLH